MLRQQIPIQQFLSNLPLFKGYAQADLERIAAGATRVHAQRGTVIFRRGETCCGMHAVLFGQLKLTLHAMQGGEHVIDLIGPGQTLGEAALFLDQPYIATAEALADTELVQISKAMVLAEADRHPEFARRVMVNLSRRLYRRISDLESYTLCSATDRVVGYLLNDLPECSEQDTASLTLPAAKGVIASRLNLTHEHFSRILRDLAIAGLIEMDGRSITIPNVDGLRARVA
jgi:CRP-like cAMP-binding protein